MMIKEAIDLVCSGQDPNEVANTILEASLGSMLGKAAGAAALTLIPGAGTVALGHRLIRGKEQSAKDREYLKQGLVSLYKNEKSSGIKKPN